MTLTVSQALDDAKPSRFHTQALVTTGLGFFAASYNLFVLTTASGLLDGQWRHPGTTSITGNWATTANVITFIGAFVGSILFGLIADRAGRKRAYGYEAFLMAIGALVSGFAPNGPVLMVARFVLGLGIGGDYPGSAVIMSEFANRKDRGKLLGWVFSAQALGIACAYMAALILVSVSRAYDVDARILLWLGVVPAAAAAYLRFTMRESPRYLVRVKGDGEGAAGLVKDISGGALEVTDPGEQALRIGFRRFIGTPKYIRYLLVTAGAWFLFDYAYYGNSLSVPSPYSSMLCPTGPDPLSGLCGAATTQSDGWKPLDTPMGLALTLIVFLLAAVPGYFIAAALVDRIGRRRLQFLGFGLMALLFLVIAALPHPTGHPALFLFLVVFGTSYFFSGFGPNTTTFIVPAEIYPTSARATGYGISAGVAKLGALLGVLVLPVIMGKPDSDSGARIAMLVFAGGAVAGALLTFLIPEGAGKTLDDLSDEEKVIVESSPAASLP